MYLELMYLTIETPSVQFKLTSNAHRSCRPYIFSPRLKTKSPSFLDAMKIAFTLGFITFLNFIKKAAAADKLQFLCLSAVMDAQSTVAEKVHNSPIVITRKMTD